MLLLVLERAVTLIMALQTKSPRNPPAIFTVVIFAKSNLFSLGKLIKAELAIIPAKFI